MSPRRDDGFTLVEALMALAIMSIAVVTLVGALTTMVSLSREHRGHAVAESAVRNFGQAVQATAQAPLALSASVDEKASSESFPLADLSTLPTGVGGTYLVDREVVSVKGYSATSVLVNRGAGQSTATAHNNGSLLVPLLVCPTADQLRPRPSSYVLPAGAKAEIVGEPEYLAPDGTFKSTVASSCLVDFRGRAACDNGDVLPECSSGLFRVRVAVTTPDDARFNGIGATTYVLVRQGSS